MLMETTNADFKTVILSYTMRYRHMNLFNMNTHGVLRALILTYWRILSGPDKRIEEGLFRVLEKPWLKPH
jgi:hypothetical protein